MKELLSYEAKKMIRSVLWGGLTLVILGAFFLLLAMFGKDRIQWNRNLITQILSMIGSLGIGIILAGLFFAPLVVAVVAYHKDLNGPLAVFEAFIPQPGWKRLAAKYIVYFTLILTGVLLASVMGYLTFALIRSAAPRAVRGQVDGFIAEVLGNPDRLEAIAVIARFILQTAFGMTVTAAFFHFFITLHAVIRHKIRHAVPLTFLAGGAFGILRAFISEQFFSTQSALGERQIAGIRAETLFEWALFLSAFLIISRLLDHKTELR